MLQEDQLRARFAQIKDKLELNQFRLQTPAAIRDGLMLEIESREILVQLAQAEVQRQTNHSAKLNRELDQLRARLKEVVG